MSPRCSLFVSAMFRDLIGVRSKTLGTRHFRNWTHDLRTILRADRRLRSSLTICSQKNRIPMLYLTAMTTLLALIYLGYAMIRPESF